MYYECTVQYNEKNRLYSLGFKSTVELVCGQLKCHCSTGLLTSELEFT